MSTNLKIAIAEPSTIIRRGLEVLLKHLPGYRIQLVEIATADSLFDSLRTHVPDILIVNPSLPGCFSLPSLKGETGCANMKCVALLYSVSDSAQLRLYDEQISIFDTVDELKHKLDRMDAEVRQEATEGDEQQSLSVREKEIVVCVVKGLTNREIADKLFLSTHTVITHRRNIARKLQIHSPSGLTVYAIVNKLIELGEINQ